MNPSLASTLTIDELAKALEVSSDQLAAISEAPEKLFGAARRQIVKGKVREIDPPTREGRRLLRRLSRLLRRLCPPHRTSHGGVAGRSCFTAARVHARAEFVVTRDVRDCYPSIHRGPMIEALTQAGLPNETSRVIGSILTPRGRLAQGSNASPAALDIYFLTMDQELDAECRQRGWRITRSADDIVISTSKMIDGESAGSLIEQCLRNVGLEFSRRKRTRNGLQARSRPQVPPLIHNIEVGHAGKLRISAPQRSAAVNAADKYLAACKAVQPRTLRAVVRNRQRLSGWIEQCSQADLSPVRELRRIRSLGDRLVLARLHSVGLEAFENKWWLDTVLHPELTRLVNAWGQTLSAANIAE